MGVTACFALPSAFMTTMVTSPVGPLAGRMRSVPVWRTGGVVSQPPSWESGSAARSHPHSPRRRHGTAGGPGGCPGGTAVNTIARPLGDQGGPPGRPASTSGSADHCHPRSSRRRPPPCRRRRLRRRSPSVRRPGRFPIRYSVPRQPAHPLPSALITKSSLSQAPAQGAALRHTCAAKASLRRSGDQARGDSLEVAHPEVSCQPPLPASVGVHDVELLRSRPPGGRPAPRTRSSNRRPGGGA